MAKLNCILTFIMHVYYRSEVPMIKRVKLDFTDSDSEEEEVTTQANVM